MKFGIATVAAIVVLCYLVGLGVKATKLDNKWIPVIVGAAGIALVLSVLLNPLAGGRPDHGGGRRRGVRSGVHGC